MDIFQILIKKVGGDLPGFVTWHEINGIWSVKCFKKQAALVQRKSRSNLSSKIGFSFANRCIVNLKHIFDWFSWRRNKSRKSNRKVFTHSEVILDLDTFLGTWPKVQPLWGEGGGGVLLFLMLYKNLVNIIRLGSSSIKKLHFD